MKIDPATRKVTLTMDETARFKALALARGVDFIDIVKEAVTAGRPLEDVEITNIIEKTFEAKPRWAYVPLEKYVEVKKEMMKRGGKEIRLPCFAPWQARWAVVVKGEIVAEWYARRDENVCGVRIPNERQADTDTAAA